ncbi:tRNA (guanosine(37)-N1)-methyltransferase TrmD [Lentisphaera profundi]|uniref:tRNA (guanine-N(1)-)-methyltransferase n=1 Tax=Lentisphaera profundi TaxID=1658616 RepID=A0ABY7VUJ3_9BACT|nr:tRNA (guanosine(37)-N1)-methyltransferase TrmD [Lentisphaera profundi]WDE97429.1 tRNA (guanosine(37)-N1)-methyltransferase TrmD [Lentisphaera profundi]
MTLFPEVFTEPMSSSILGRAVKADLVKISIHNLREYSTDKHRRVDDRPYGGGPGMVMSCDTIFKAIEDLKTPTSKVIYMSPSGEVFKQRLAEELVKEEHLIILCGHYEGVDQRVLDGIVDREISIGDYILSNGNLAAMVISDAVIRLIPGALGCSESAIDESFNQENGLLEYPQYTRPEEFRQMRVPEVLLSGNHKKIKEWRSEQSYKKTLTRRPDLLKEI